ncbi:MAG: response regulator transcription factor [Actinobacteria bacterium]|nr:response regulator transcription factor [Actinomycetota bacterium]
MSSSVSVRSGLAGPVDDVTQLSTARLKAVWQRCGDRVEVFGEQAGRGRVKSRVPAGPSGGSGQDVGVADVLVVEDERDIRELLRRYLERDGHSVMTTSTGAQALLALVDQPPDLVLLDLGLPDIDGIEVLAAAKAAGISVIALTARSSVEERIDGLSRGADDYVVKPFSPQEVVLRVAAVLGRGAGVADDGVLSFGGGRLRIDSVRHRASLSSRDLELTPSEWGILVALAATPGRVYSRAELVNRARGYEYSGFERTVDSHVKNLRRKLGPEGAAIVETVLGVGYRLGLERDR